MKTRKPIPVDDKPLPLDGTAVLSPRIEWHLAIAWDGKIFLVFPRGMPYMDIKRIKDRLPDSEIRMIQVRTTYEILKENYHYDTSATL